MNNPLVQPDPGLFIWTVLTFLVLLTLLAKFAWGPLLKALDGRQQAIRNALDDAQQAKQELEPRVNSSWAVNAAANAARSGRRAARTLQRDRSGCPADDPRSAWFVDGLGWLHQAVAAACTDVTLMVAGIEVPVKRGAA